MQPPKKLYLQKKKHKLYNTYTKFRRKPDPIEKPSAPQENPAHGTLCFFLGLLLGPFGVIAAAVVSKAVGAFFALFGFGVWIVIAVLISALCCIK